jgi:hypothetical protein
MDLPSVETILAAADYPILDRKNSCVSREIRSTDPRIHIQSQWATVQTKTGLGKRINHGPPPSTLTLSE